MKKKLLSVLLAGCMVLSLAACGNDGASTPDAGQTQPETQAPAADTTDNAATDTTEGGTLRRLMLPRTRLTVSSWTVSLQKRERLR